MYEVYKYDKNGAEYSVALFNNEEDAYGFCAYYVCETDDNENIEYMYDYREVIK